MAKPKHLTELNDVKKRLSDDLTEGKEILNRLEPLLDPQKMPSVTLYAGALRKVVQQEEALLEPIQKEIPEALKAANLLLDAMETSRQSFKTILAGLSYHYGSEAPEVLEFVSPPNAFGYGRESEGRGRAHLRVAEAFQRRIADFEQGSRLRRDLEEAIQIGQELEQARQAYLKEAGESNHVVRQAMDALAEFRKQKSLLRRALMLELPNASDTYKYIPKLNTKPQNTDTPSKNPADTETPNPSEPTPTA